MARERFVTRTVKVTNYEVMSLNILTSEVVKQVLPITGDSIPDDKALARLRKFHETDTVKLVAITGKNEVEELYGMPEVDFLKYASKLDPETRKVLAQETV